MRIGTTQIAGSHSALPASGVEGIAVVALNAFRVLTLERVRSLAARTVMEMIFDASVAPSERDDTNLGIAERFRARETLGSTIPCLTGSRKDGGHARLRHRCRTSGQELGYLHPQRVVYLDTIPQLVLFTYGEGGRSRQDGLTLTTRHSRPMSRQFSSDCKRLSNL